MSTVSISVDISDIMDELDTDELKRELVNRGEDMDRLSESARDYAEQARHSLLRGNAAEAMVYLDMALYGRQSVKGAELMVMPRSKDQGRLALASGAA